MTRTMALLGAIFLFLFLLEGSEAKAATYDTAAAWDCVLPCETYTWVFVIDPDLEYNESAPPVAGDEPAYAAYNAAIAAADSVIDLSLVPGVAYAGIDQADPNDYYSMALGTSTSGGPGDTWATENSATTNNRRLTLMRIPWEDLLPERAEILDAAWEIVPIYTAYIEGSDSLVVTLMTNEDDDRWWTSTGNAGKAHASNASWDWQITTSASTGTDPWSPALNDRDDWIDWGAVSDMSGGSLNGNAIEANSHHPVKIRNCVQAAVNGRTNNGMMLNVLEMFGTTQVNYKLYHLDKPADRPCWFEVTFTTREYSPPFDGKEWAFVFTTDDGMKAANDTFRNVYAEFEDAMFTANISLDQMGNTYNWNPQDAALWDADPHVEVGLHGKYHDAVAGGFTMWGAFGEIPDGVPFSGDAAWDSLIVDTSPDWLIRTMIDYDGIDRSCRPYFAKVVAFPGQHFDGAVLRALDFNGLSGYRCDMADIGMEDGRRLLMRPSSSATTDTALGGFARPHAPRAPRNLDLVPLTVISSALVGDLSTLADPADIRREVRRRTRSLLAQDRRLLSTYTHDLKFAENGASGYYGGGIEGVELRAILEEVVAMDGAIMSVTDYVKALKSRAIPVATPDGYGQDSAYKWTAAERRYWSPLFPTWLDYESPVEIPEEAPRAVARLSCYPNPCNPMTTVHFDLPRRETATLQVFDLSGRLVQTLFSGVVLDAGHHSQEWNGCDHCGRQVASGAYLVRLDAADAQARSIVTLVK